MRIARNRATAPGIAVVLTALLANSCADRSSGPAAGSAPAAKEAIAPPVAAGPAPAPPSDPSGGIRLREVTRDCGIAFEHVDGSSGRRYVVEAMSTGLATLDYDGDGLLDLYFPNGAPLPGWSGPKPPRHALYRNLGGWKFKDVTDEAGIGCTAYGMGVTVGDYDNDGHPDLYLSNYGLNALYRNHGAGGFADVTAAAGVARDQGGQGRYVIGAGACFLDADRDGELDLYVGNYILLDCAKHVPRKERGHPAYPSPRDYAPLPDTLYLNRGDGTFADVSRSSGVASVAGRSMGMVAFDYDNDGDTDVFVCNDVMENFLLRNDGKGRFEEVGVLAGVAMNRQGELIANMGVDCADFNHDGLLDLFTTNYQGQLPMLFRNFGDGIFEDVGTATNATAGSYPYVNWGCGWVDFDNDGHRDLFIANGHTEDNIEQRDLSTCHKCPNLLLRNLGNGKFANVSDLVGDGLKPVESSRGTVFDDLDNDGDIDAVVLNSRARPTVLRNMLQESGGKNHWLQLQLRGVKTNRDGVGAHVTVIAGGLRQSDEVHSGRGYQSHWGSRLHFGLGAHGRVDRVEVRWIGGGTDVIENLPADRLITLVESATNGPK